MIKLGSNSIGKLYLGSNKIGKAYLGSNLVYQTGSGPSPSTMIPYIRGGANGAYIDTGITADNTVRVIIRARNWNPGSGTIVGSRVAGTNATYGFGTHTLDAIWKIRLDYNNSVSTYTNVQYNNLCGYHKYEFYDGKLYVDDTLQASAATGTFSNNYNIYLFGVNTAGVYNPMVRNVDICSAQIYKNGVLVRDYTPVNSPSVGLYDAVSSTVFTNAGSGSFSYGAFNPNAYTPLEYIGCSYQQYFDTGLYGTKGLTTIARFMATDSVAQFKRVYGCRKGSSEQYELMVGNTSVANRYFDMRSGGSYYRIDASASQTNYDLVFQKDADNNGSLYKNNVRLGSIVTGQSTDFNTSPYTIYIGTSNSNGEDVLAYPFYGRIYYIGFGSERSFVPAKVNNVAGMYDTYNDVFYQSESGTPFVEGPTL